MSYSFKLQVLTESSTLAYLEVCESHSYYRVGQFASLTFSLLIACGACNELISSFEICFKKAIGALLYSVEKGDNFF